MLTFTSGIAQTIPAAQPKLTTRPRTDENEKFGHNIHCSLLDKTGTLWFGSTGDGVYRFDGKSFLNFTTENGLNNNCVWSMMEDKVGNIWFGTEAGVCCYNGTSIINFPMTIGNKRHLPQGVYSMLQDKNGILWFGTANGIYCFNGKSLTHFLENDGIANPNGLHLKRVERMLEDENGTIWFCSGMGGEEGICRYDGKSISSFKPNGDVWVPYVLEDKIGNIWFSGRSHGYFRYDGKTFTDFTENVGVDSLSKNSMENICLTGKVGFGPMVEDKAGNIWFTGKAIRFGGNGGIWRYDGKSCMNYTVGLENYYVWSMIADADGNIWVGTNNTGLFRFDGKTFTRFSE